MKSVEHCVRFLGRMFWAARTRLARSTYASCLLLVCIAYVGVYGLLIWKSDFLPYVMDNNETFSSLVHASNLLRYGLSESFGIADEAYGPNPAAHPYVHTHQGNFPRLFAAFIYILGARTAETQILVTTFTVGFAAIFFIYHFFSRLATPWFAATVSIVFMTDYVLFAQWHIVTYRVWSSFLLFACLLCTHHASEADNRRWWWVTALAFACLFYSELVFAAFACVFCGLYAIARTFRAIRRLAHIWVAQGLGATVGLIAVFGQAIGYLGIEDFQRDLYLTFLARNDFASTSTLLQEAGRFFGDRHIVFWYNIQERAPFMSVSAFVRSLTSFDWRIHTPLFAVTVWTLAFGWLLSLEFRRRASAEPTPGYAVAASCAVLLFGVFVFAAYPSFRPDTHLTTVGAAVVKAISALAVSFAVGLIAIAISAVSVQTSPNRLGLGPHRVTGRTARTFFIAGLLFSGCGLLVRSHATLFGETYRPMWDVLHSRAGPSLLHVFVLGSAATVATYVATAGSRRVLGDSPNERLTPVFAYLACGFAAYGTVYLLSPGYILSGYLDRHAPLTVFLTDVIVAIGIYIALRSALHLFRSLRLPGIGSSWRTVLLAYARVSLTIATAGLAAFLVVYWVILQASYVRWMPPTHYAFLKSLAKPPFHGASFVVDNYAAPVAVYTGQWAYLDPEIAQGRFVHNGATTRLMGDRRYLWLADGATNPEYRKPDYFLCMVPQNPMTVLARIQYQSGRGSMYPGCSTRPLVQLAVRGESPPLNLQVVASDKQGPERIGFDAWSIVKFDWGDPANPVEIEWSTPQLMRTEQAPDK